MTLQQPYRPSGRVLAVIWKCQVCNRLVRADEGYIERDYGRDDGKEAPWRCLHKACDPSPGKATYWIDVGRISTDAELDEWLAHLNEKVWFDEARFLTFVEQNSESAMG